MNRIYITGDVHGGHDVQKLFVFYDRVQDLDLSDVMIVAGDWGYIWFNNPKNFDEREKKTKLSKNMTYFIVPGNHENYDRIEKLPVKEVFGNTVRYEPEHPNIYYAINGNLYKINGKKIWTMGGGDSVDKHRRTKHLNWWPQEVPEREELETVYAAKNFVNADCIVTHTCPLDLQPFDKFLLAVNQITVKKGIEIMLQKVWDSFTDVNRPKWYCGHFHLDEKREVRFLYNDIWEIK